MVHFSAIGSRASQQQAVVFVVDHQRTRRVQMERRLSHAGFAVRGFASAADFLAMEEATIPVCVLLELDLVDMYGLELQRHLKHLERGEKIVFTTETGSIASCVQAMKAGAVDYLAGAISEKALVEAVRNALTRSAAWWRKRASQTTAKTRLAMLTRREMEVLKQMIRGRLNRQIAETLGAAEATIKIHRRHIMEKLAVRSLPEVVIIAQTAGMIPMPQAIPTPVAMLA